MTDPINKPGIIDSIYISGSTSIPIKTAGYLSVFNLNLTQYGLNFEIGGILFDEKCEDIIRFRPATKIPKLPLVHPR